MGFLSPAPSTLAGHLLSMCQTPCPTADVGYPLNTLVGLAQSLVPFYRWGNQAFKTLSNCPELHSQ